MVGENGIGDIEYVFSADVFSALIQTTLTSCGGVVIK